MIIIMEFLGDLGKAGEDKRMIVGRYRNILHLYMKMA
jgi:hypothetical protein